MLPSKRAGKWLSRNITLFAYLSAFTILAFLIYQIKYGYIDLINPTLIQRIGFLILGGVFSYLSYYAFKQHSLHLSKRCKRENSSNYGYGKIEHSQKEMRKQVLKTQEKHYHCDNATTDAQQYPSDVAKKVVHFSFLHKKSKHSRDTDIK